MKVVRLAAGAAALLGPLLLTAASNSPRSTHPARCYDGAIYESISGYPSAAQLLQAHLDNARAAVDDLTTRAPQVGDDPYYQVNLDNARGQVEGFSALLPVVQRTPHPSVDTPLQAFDDQGQLIAEVTFDRGIHATAGTYALDAATLPNPGRDPAHGCAGS